MFDYLIVGAGFAGSVLAERLASQLDKKVLVIDKRPHKGEPYYPIPRAANTEMYKQYKVLAKATPGVHFVGRIATHKYYNIDQVVAQALSLFRKLSRQDLEQTDHAVSFFPSAS